MSDDEMASAISENYPQFSGDPASSSKPAAAPAAKAATVPNPVAPAQPAASSGILDTIGGWYDKAKQAVLDVPVLAPGQEPGQPAPGADPLAGLANAKGGPDLSDLPVTPEYLRAMQAQWNAATPAQRRQLAERKDHMGVVARRLNEARPKLAAEEAPDTLGILGNKGVQLDTTSALDQLDPTAEARTRRLIRGGVRGDLAEKEAHVAAARDIPVGAEASLRSSASASDFDFETFRKFNEDPFWKNPVVRGAVKGYEGYKQGILGMNQAIGEAVGADVSGQARLAKESRGFTDAMGESPDYLQRNFEGTISSIAQQLPALIGGAASGSEALVLGSMFAQSFGQEYSDSRAKGQEQGAALTRAGLFGAFEVVGEKLGLGERLALLRNSARGVETNVLAKWMANTLKEELPGEMLTTTGQFLTDKLPGIGMNREAGLADYLQQMGDTVTQTIMQGGIMSAGTGGVNHARAYLNGAFDRGAEHDANAAQRDALNRWNTNGLSPNSRSSGNGGGSAWGNAVNGAGPAPRVEPTLGDIAGASSVDEAINAAAAVAAAPVAAPASTSAFPTAAEIDALEEQAGLLSAAQTPPADLPPGGKTAPAADIAAAPAPESGNLTNPASSGDATDWHPFPPESRTLGVPRAQMPQIRAEHRGAMVNFLNARGISHEQVEVPADSLKPTQREFSVSKVDKALEYEGGNRSILISSDNYVLDGHHQWMAAAVKDEPVQAIRLNAPIKELVKTVHEFPSSTVDTSSAQTVGLGQGARLGQTNLEAARAKHERQDDEVRKAAENIAKRKATAGQRARDRVTQENPFLGFLANHGVQIDERSDTGGQKGRSGGVMVPGYGPLYRAGGKRLDELAQLAHEAGFLSDQDIADPTDNGGTRKLADMIQRAAHSKEVIQPAGLLDAIAPTADQQLLAEAQRLGLDTEGKTADQLYDAVTAAHDAEDGRRQASGADTVDEQDAIDRYADQFTDAEARMAAELLRDADIPLEGGTPSNNLTDEEIDAIFGIQPGSARAAGQEAEEGAAGTANEGAARAGQPGQDEGQDLLTSYSAADVVARDEEAAARAKAVQAERDRLEAQRKKEQDAKEAKTRADATVDDFQLGQDALDQLNRQNGLFDAPAGQSATNPAESETEPAQNGKKAPESATTGPVVTRGEDGRAVLDHARLTFNHVTDFDVAPALAAKVQEALRTRPDAYTVGEYRENDTRITLPKQEGDRGNNGGQFQVRDNGRMDLLGDNGYGWASTMSQKSVNDTLTRWLKNMPAEGEAEQGPAAGKIVPVTAGPTAQRLAREDKHVFAQPRIHTYDATQARPVVLISCSDAKLEGGPHRAVDLYQGALFDVLRKWMPQTNRPDVYIISAQHGLVHANDMLESYEQPMTQERLEALMKKGIAAARIGDKNFSEVFIAGSARYRELGQTYAERLRKAGFVGPDAQVLGSAAGAGIGSQRGDLGEYLRGLEAKGTPETEALANRIEANQERVQQLDAERQQRVETERQAETERKAAEVKTPGTNLVWSTLGEWMDAYKQLDGRAASSKRTVQLKEHIGQLAKNPDKITGETDAGVLEQAKTMLEGLQAGRGKRETDPATKAVQLIGTQLAKVQSGRAQLDNATAPEHIAGVDDRELGQIVEEFNDAQAEMMQDGHPITNVFRPPTKGEVVRLEDKTRVYTKEHGWMTVAEARARIAEWKAHALEQGEAGKGRSENSKRVVLSLFDLTGKWSKPWEEAGYQVYRFDIQDDPVVGDVNNFSAGFFTDWFGDFDGMDVYAVLAACPCTDFASSGSRHFAAKDADGRTVASVKLVHQTLRVIEHFKPAVWAVENPVGRIEKLGGLPPWRLSFNPNHLGDPYTKRTLIWGRFNGDLPVAPVEPTEGSKMHKLYGGKSMATKNARSATPEGFSYGFFMANNAIDNPVLAIHGKYDRLDRSLIERAVAAGVTEDEISSAVDDHYYMELDDDAANDAIRNLIDEAQADGRAAPGPAVDDVGQIPLDFYKGVTTQYRALGTGELTAMPANEALDKTREDIDQLEAMLKCMGA